MSVRRVAFVFSLVVSTGMMLSCGNSSVPPPPPPPSGQILYIINSGTVSAYSIDPKSLSATALEQPVALIPPSEFLVQFDPSPDDHFIYVVWSDGQSLQHLSVYQTDSSGVPQIPAIQELNANSLSQFNMHPSGRFAYMLEVTSSNNLYLADIRLFNVQTGQGTLEENPQVQGSYGPANYWPAFLYGFSTDGSKLYDTSTLTTGAVYRQRSIDRKNGTLGGDRQLLSVSSEEEVALGRVIVDQYRSDFGPSQSYLDIFPDTPNPSRPAIRCTLGMLRSCATATNVQLDPSGRYLVLTDPAAQEVRIAAINLPGRKVSYTGSSMPMTSQTPDFAFDPEGTIVYAVLAKDDRVHFYQFDRASGVLREGGTPLAVAAGSGICPAHYR